MKLHVEHVLPVPPDEAVDLFDSEAFRERMNATAPVRSEILETRREGAIEVRRLRFVGQNDLPAIVARVVGAPRLVYEQTNRLDRARRVVEWVVRVPATDRLRCSGRTTFHEHPQGSRRVLDGELEVAVPIVGRQVEKLVAPEFERSLGRAAEIALELVRER